MRAFLAVVLVVSAYVAIYYRLVVRYYYQKQFNVKESTFGAIFSFPPYKILGKPAQKYVRRYWVAVAVMVGVVVCLTLFVNLPFN